MKNTVKITARTAMLAAVIFCLTYFVKIPFPGGYVHLGDAAISLAALWLPAPWAMTAAAVGAGLADIAGGYAAYAPITLVTKAVMALVAAPILRKKHSIATFCLAGIAAGIVNVAGYFIGDCILSGEPLVALSYTPANALQSAASLIIFVVVAKILDKKIKF
ncbi:MAG: ECF transporter S component [Clostridia bacterium]|nr:ECF transporter S component [Clostridia bacterium]